MLTLSFDSQRDYSQELRQHGLLYLKGADAFSADQLLQFAASLGQRSGSLREKILHWDFGPIMHMRWDPLASNYLFSEEAVPLHWDGAFHREPRLLVFYCTEGQGDGGETLFCDTSLMRQHLPESFGDVLLTYETDKLAHYGGTFTTRLFEKHPQTGRPIVRFAEEVPSKLNPVKLTIDGIDDPRTFYQTMVEHCYDPRFLTEHRWSKHDLIICDNATFLHGRRALNHNHSRAFMRVQVL